MMTTKQFTIYLNQRAAQVRTETAQRIAQRQTEKARKALMERLQVVFSEAEAIQ